MSETAASVSQAHDHFARTAMTDLRVAREFFAMHLPNEICRVMDFDQLQLQPRSHINDVREESIVDLLYKTVIGGHEAYLYLLLEHQSSPDKFMALRMLKYTCNVLDQYHKKNPRKQLPLVYPMVLYHGQRAYCHSTDICDLIDAPRELVDKYFLKPFHLVDLNKIADEELRKQKWAGAMQFVMKHIFVRDFLIPFMEIKEKLQWLHQNGGKDFVSLMLLYALDRGEMNPKEFIQIVNTEIALEEKNMATAAEQLRTEGMLEGMQKGIEKGMRKGKIEGKLEIAERLLMEGSKPPFIAKITGLPLSEIEALQKYIG